MSDAFSLNLIGIGVDVAVRLSVGIGDGELCAVVVVDGIEDSALRIPEVEKMLLCHVIKVVVDAVYGIVDMTILHLSE